MLVTKLSTESFARREAGGKGYNLYLLTREGLPVPRWTVVGASYFREFREANRLDGAIVELLGQATATRDYAEASRAIRQLILGAPLPAQLDVEVRRAAADVGPGPIAVRSSALEEDGALNSFAGQLSTFLYVRGQDATIAAMLECWASAFSERSLSYRVQRGVSLTRVPDVGVVFQEMIDSEKSGVLFSCDPVTGDPTVTTINAVYGIGEGLVSGLLDADTFLVEKASGRLVRSDVVSKPMQLSRRDGANGLEETAVAEALRDMPSLDARELADLMRLGEKVERFYMFPQDVEWGYAGGRFYLLQSRPVTSSVKNAKGTLHIWDNSNIVESYGGITLPLTFTFAHYVYNQVYVQFCEVLMVPQSEIRNMEPFLKNMLGLFYGRVYYNLLNWYKLTSILPGFKMNRAFMETMMGTGVGLADEIADRIKPPSFNERFGSKVRRAITGAKFFYFHLTAQEMVDDFLAYFHEVYGEYRKKDYSRLPADEIKKDWHDLERRLLREWKAPIINDFLCMVHFGLLKKLTSDWLSAEGDALQNDLLCGEGNLESAEPTRELIRMAAAAFESPALKGLIESTPAEDCLEALQQSPHDAFRARVARYIDLYGHRCMSEMKLEQKDLHQDPSFLFVCLRNYLRSGQTDLEAYEKREKEIRSAAESRARGSLRGWKRPVYFWSLKHARRAVRNRENTRFCRTRVYGIVRSMFYGMGNDFTRTGIIDRAEDVFYLSLNELLGAADGILTCQDLRAVVEMRKREYARYVPLEPSPRFMTRGLVYWRNEHFPRDEDAATEELPPGHLRGTGCCPGIVEGTVKVVLTPDDDMNFNGEILVTHRTDPGWIPLYPSASGLLVERGGLLSHSAIVAREMGLPTVVGVKGLTQQLKSGMRVRFDGQTGLIQILPGDAVASAEAAATPPS